MEIEGEGPEVQGPPSYMDDLKPSWSQKNFFFLFNPGIMGAHLQPSTQEAEGERYRVGSQSGLCIHKGIPSCLLFPPVS